MSQQKNLRIAFIHPDLGIGGAEQLIVNFALALIKKGHTVRIFTPYHDKNHCFPETRDGTIDVEVRGNVFPKSIFGKFIAMCSAIRMLLATLWVVFFGEQYDVYVLDQVSFSVPILRLFGRKVLFYCHFPDKLLSVERSSYLKKFYRFFLDYGEELSLLPSNLIVTNSEFSKDIFKSNFKILTQFKFDPDVFYPAIDFDKFDQSLQKLQQSKDAKWNYGRFFVSLNRYERKKNVNLAIEAYAQFQKLNNNQFDVKLVIAGGYDLQNRENVEHLEELKQLATKLNVEKNVIFRCSVPDDERTYILNNAIAVLYTPENEHFGIVPIEAMYSSTPIIACNSGGPKESVVHNKSGFLLQQKAEVWAEHMNDLAKNPQKVIDMGTFGKQHVRKTFGLDTFAQKADEYVRKIKFGKNYKKDI